MHSRTVSLSRTWTSRTTNAPDWLLGARRTPAEVTRPGSPATDGRDVEQGMDEVNRAGAVEAAAKSQQDVSAHDEKRVPELGPAAMISDATAMSPVDVDQRMSEKDEESRVSIPILIPYPFASSPCAGAERRVQSQTPLEQAKVAHLEKWKAGDKTPLPVDDDPAGRPLPSGVQTPVSDPSVYTYTPQSASGAPSGAQTPVSQGPRTVRFPPADELATYLATPRAAGAGGGGCSQPPSASARAVRFPENVTGAGPGAGAGEDTAASATSASSTASASAAASQPARGLGASDVVEGAGSGALVAGTGMGTGGGGALGRDASVVSAQ